MERNLWGKVAATFIRRSRAGATAASTVLLGGLLLRALLAVVFVKPFHYVRPTSLHDFAGQ